MKISALFKNNFVNDFYIILIKLNDLFPLNIDGIYLRYHILFPMEFSREFFQYFIWEFHEAFR